jgi:hypothetical protein
MSLPAHGNDEAASEAALALKDDSAGLPASDIAARLRQALQIQGIPPRQQAPWVARLCGISLSQARRKLPQCALGRAAKVLQPASCQHQVIDEVQ